MNIINPYELMGINENSSNKELKNKYYELALICHPDKGGKKEDMIVIHNAYIFLKKQLDIVEKNKKTYKEIKKDFDSYNKIYKELPEFKKIYKLSSIHNFNKKFNRKFLKKKTYNNFDDGYDNLKLINNEFNKKLTIYKKPIGIKTKNMDGFKIIDNKKINDFSAISQQKLYMTDYELAYSKKNKIYKTKINNKSLKELIKEREKIYDVIKS